MRRSGGVLLTSFAFLLAALLPGAVVSTPVWADVPQSGFAPNLAVIGIRDIQRQLRVHGYDPGPDSGVMNDTTRAAILAYQHDYGLREDGIAGPALQNMLHFLRRRPAAPTEASDDAEPLPAPLADLMPPQAAPPPPAPAPAEVSDDAAPPPGPPAELLQPPAMPPPPAPPPAEASDDAVVPPAPLAALLQPQPAAPPPPVRYAAPPATATVAPTSLYPPIIAPPSAAPRKQAAQAARALPAIPPMGDIASLAPPPPPSPEPAPLLDPLAVIAIAVPPKPAVATLKSPYPDPLAAIAIQMPAVAPPPENPKNEEPLPALAFAPPIRMPARTPASSHDGPQLVAEPRIPVSSAPLGTDPAHPLPAPAFVPPPFSTAPTDAPELTGDLYVRQVQEYLKQLGYFSGEANGVLDWATVQALVKFDASGAGPSSVIADPKHLDEVWIARLKTALAAKGTSSP